MQAFPREFLTDIARRYDLSEKQKEAFFALFSSGMNQKESVEHLHISDSAFRTRMTGVYQKFSFNKSGPNKAQKLYDFLQEESKKWATKETGTTLTEPINIDTLVQQVRATIRDKIQERCGKMKILDMEQPTGLGNIYTHVNILQKIIGRRRKKNKRIVRRT